MFSVFVRSTGKKCAVSVMSIGRLNAWYDNIFSAVCDERKSYSFQMFNICMEAATPLKKVEAFLLNRKYFISCVRVFVMHIIHKPTQLWEVTLTFCVQQRYTNYWMKMATKWLHSTVQGAADLRLIFRK